MVYKLHIDGKAKQVFSIIKELATSHPDTRISELIDYKR